MEKEIKHKRSMWKRFLLWLFLAFFLLIAGTSAYFFFNAERIINNNFSGFIYKKTNQTYRFNFDSFKINFPSKKIIVKNLSLKPDTLAERDSTRALYQFSTPLLVVSRISIISLLYKRFDAELVKVERPEFKLNTGEKISFRQLSKKQVKKGDTLNIPVFSEIFFDTLLIVDAQAGIDTLLNPSRQVPKINLEAIHFKLGGKKCSNTPLPFDVLDIFLKVENLTKNLPDSIHRLTVKQIDLSLVNSKIQARGIVITPISDTLAKENLYHIEIPEVSLFSNQISQFHQTDTVTISKLVANTPSIQIKFGTKVARGTPLNELNFYKLIGERFRWIIVNRFSITNADVRMFPAGSNKMAEHFEGLFINFDNFRVDSASYKASTRILGAQNAAVLLKKFILFHNDEVHELTIDNLKINTRQNCVYTGAVEFRPVNAQVQNKVNTIINIKSDGVVFKGVDLLKMYHRQILPMKELIIKSPVTRIGFQHRFANKKRRADQKSIILEKTKDYLKGIYVEKTEIENGELRYNYINENEKSGFFSTRFNFELSKLSVDSVTFYQSDKIFFAQNFDLNFSNISLQLADDIHRMFADSLNLSSEGHNGNIFNLRVVPFNKKPLTDTIKRTKDAELFNICFPRIKLSGANLHHAFFYKKLYINNFTVYDPVFNVEKYGQWTSVQQDSTHYQTEIYSLISDYLLKIRIRNLNMDNGKLNLTQHKKGKPDFQLSNLFSIKMKNFEIDANSSRRKDKLFFSDNIDLILKNHTFSLADGVHKIDADEIGILSSEKRVYILGAKLYPDILSSAFHNLSLSVFANIPEVQITNADIFGLFNKGNFPVNTIRITHPNIRLLFQKTGKNGKNDTIQQPVFLLKDLKSVSAQNIIVDKGHLELSNYENFTNKPFVATKANFEINNFTVKQSHGTFRSSYSGFNIDLNGLTSDFPDQIHSLAIDNIHYSLNNELLTIKNISVFPKRDINRNSKEQFINLKVPLVKLYGFNFKKYIDTKNITSDEFNIENPLLKINDNRIEKEKIFSPYDIELYPVIRPFAQAVTIKNTAVENANIDLETDKPIHLKGLSIRTKNFVIDKDNTNRNKLLESVQTDIHLQNIKGKTKDGCFAYKADDFKLNDKGTFNLTGVSLTPLYSWEEFARLKEYEADYFTIERVDFSGKGLDVKKFIENNDIVMTSLNADFHNVSIKRDKTYPLNPAQWIKMPQQSLRDLKQKLDIGQANLTADKFEYTELVAGAPKKSFVFVTGVTAQLSNITNIDQLLSANPNIMADIKGNLMNAGEISIEMRMNVRSFGNEFTFNGQCDEMPLNLLNPITEPALNLSIKEGINKKMEVYFEANGDSATGNMRFAYNDLKISVLNTKGGEQKEGKFVSFLVNSIALRSDNPKAGRILLPAKFKKYRNKRRSVVGYCWQSVYAGIKSTLGLKEKEERTK